MKQTRHNLKTTEYRILSQFSDIRTRLARSLIGHPVSLMVDARTIARGIVSDVLTGPGVPRIVVDGMAYNPSQVLAAWPASLG